MQVLKSMIRPKVLRVRCSDGRTRALMCKSADDMRKDQRLQEFVGVVNECLRSHADTRTRRLHVRTFAVIPLGNQGGGLVEWVPNLKSFSSCLT
jgi:phosphatidylinositol kinase/protein kinase (PI-3  family)